MQIKATAGYPGAHGAGDETRRPPNPVIVVDGLVSAPFLLTSMRRPRIIY
jgi:hypothetical protein